MPTIAAPVTVAAFDEPGRFMRAMLLAALTLLATGCARLETATNLDRVAAEDDATTAADSAADNSARRDSTRSDSARVRHLPPMDSDVDLTGVDRAGVVQTSYEWAVHDPFAFERLPQVDDDAMWRSAVREDEPRSNVFAADRSRQERLTLRGFLDDVWQDHRHYYSPTSLAALAAGFGVGAAIANSSADEGFRDFYQENVRDTKTDEWAEALHTPTVLGNGMMVLPFFAATAMAGEMMDDMPMMSTAGDWGEQSLRTALVGFPAMLLMQKVTGASRPDETGHDSQWRFWNDENGVSGHSFMGAAPLITAAKMTANPWWKATFYLASTGAGLSRINDDRHYTSQVLLGWWMAYVAADAVMQTENGEHGVTLVPLESPDAAGIGVEFRR